MGGRAVEHHRSRRFVAAVLAAALAVGGLVATSVAPAAAAPDPTQVSTVAGTVQPGGAAAPAAQVAQVPMGVAISGSVAYVADPRARVVRLLSGCSGLFQGCQESVYAGTGESGTTDGAKASATFVEPVAVAVATNGDVYVADRGAHEVRRISAGGTVSTVLGMGVPGFSGDGGPGTQALINDPAGVAVDASGNLYVADRGNDRIRRVAGPATAGSTVTTVATGLHAPAGVAADPAVAGRIVVVEQGEGTASTGPRVALVQGGVVTRIAGSGAGGFSDGSAASAQFLLPQAVAVVGTDLVVSDTFNSRLRRVWNYAGGAPVVATVAGTDQPGFDGDGVATAQRLSSPWGIAATSGGDLVVGDVRNGRVRTVTLSAVTPALTTVAGPGRVDASATATAAQIGGPRAVAVTADGLTSYVADTENCVVRKLNGGTATVVAGIPGAGGPTCGFGSAPSSTLGTTVALSRPGGLALDGVGGLYIADSDNNRVLKLTLGTGNVVQVAGAADGTADSGCSTAKLNRPSGLVVIGSDLYVADTGQHCIRKLTGGTGTPVRIAGTGTPGSAGDGGSPTSAGLYAPQGLAVDFSGRLYVADTGNNKVRRITFTPSATITTVAGTGAQGAAGDDGPAIAATLLQPSGVAVDSAGFVYIADTLNSRIRVVSPTGTMRLLGGVTTSPGFGGDGGRSEVAAFAVPGGLAVDGSGAVLVTDTGNDRLRRIEPIAVPGAPQNVTAAAGSTSVVVSFLPPADDGGLPITGYAATASPGGQSCTWSPTAISGPPGCTIPGLTGGTGYTVTVRAVNDEGQSAPATASPSPVTPAAAYRFHPVTPTRILDSRVGPQYTSPWIGGQIRPVKVAGPVAGASNPVPASGVSAVVVNITATDTTGPGFATLYPGAKPPNASSVNWVPGQTVANQAIVAVGGGGNVNLYNHFGSSANLILDVVGWFDDGTTNGNDGTGSGYTAVDPARIVDSRFGIGTTQAPWGPGTTRAITVTGGSVPGNATGVVLNVTATDTTSAGFLSVFPGGQSRPNASSVNWAAGQTVANQVSVPVGGGGTVNVYNHLGSTSVVVDVVGYYTGVGGVGFHPVTPTRVLDSRDGTGGISTPWGSTDTRSVQAGATYGSTVPMTGVSAVVANATVTNTVNPGFLLLYPQGANRPNASTVNWVAGETRANVTTAKVSSTGGLAVYNHIGPADVIIDVTGWYG